MSIHVGHNIEDVPVVFGFIFSTPEELGLPRDNMTGVTRRSFAPDIWNLARQIFGAESVGLLSKESRSMMGVRSYILAMTDDLEQASGVRVQEMYLVNTFEEWAEQVENWEYDLIYLADTSRIEKDGERLSSDEIVAWTVENATVPVIAANERDTRAGALFSIVTCERQIGWEAGERVLRILNGTPVSDIPAGPTAEGRLLINAATVEKTGANISYDIITSADAIFE